MAPADDSTVAGTAAAGGRPDRAQAAAQVVQRHLDAVRALDPQAMAADYAPDAVLERPDRHWNGQAEISAYFATVPSRLAGARVEFVGFDRERLEVRWRLVGGSGDGLQGRDRYVVRAGRIVRQTVLLDGDEDF